MIVSRQPRRAVVSVEAAIIFPVVILLILGLIVGSLGIFRYQEVCYLAREGARYASVRGTDYKNEVSGATAATAQDVYDNAIKPRVMVLDPTKLSSSVSWDSSNAPYSMISNYEVPKNNTVTVTVTYQWLPELYIIGPITLTASSTLPMSY